MKDELQKLFTEIILELGVSDVIPEVEISGSPEHGEYTTNFALRLAAKLKEKSENPELNTPKGIALWVIEHVDSKKKSFSHKSVDHNTTKTDQKNAAAKAVYRVLQDIDHLEVADPGFINVFLTEANLSRTTNQVLKEADRFGTRKSSNTTLKKVMVEFAHPNTHKAFHIGHLRNITTGETIVRLLESQGIAVIRANYQGDVGMHIAKCLYALTRLPAIQNEILDVRGLDIHAKVEFLGRAYAAGSKAYEEDEKAKAEIAEINLKIYSHDKSLADLYNETRSWSLEYFAGIYQRLNSHFDRLYFESEVYESGKATVLKGLEKGIFNKSDGAIIFPGEKYGLHNRVFITHEGNPTYEGKDMGLAQLQFKEYHPDLIIHCVGPEQAGYFQVIFKALEQLFPEMKGKEFHQIYGWVRLKEGKMSSRLGNVITGEWLLDEAKAEVQKILDVSIKKYNKREPSFAQNKDKSYGRAQQETIAEAGAIAAVKYAFLRVGLKNDIAFDFKASVTLEGDSGPYLLYSYARCKSVLRKAEAAKADLNKLSEVKGLPTNPEEKLILRLMSFFPEVVAQAASAYTPNTLCTYLYTLAQAYNLFYQKHQILESENQNFRLALTAATAQVIHNGLHFLGINTIEQM